MKLRLSKHIPVIHVELSKRIRTDSQFVSDTTEPRTTDPAFPTTRHVLESDCTRCPALVAGRECISWGTGRSDASILVIGEAPGYGNPDALRWRGGNWTGKAYTSRHSGRRIRSMIEKIGYSEDVYFTNAVKCFPADENSEPEPTNREPTPEERENCRVHLLTEFETVSPDVILATGKHATTTVLEIEGEAVDKFLEMVLEPRRCERLETWLLPVFHPSYQDVWVGRLGYDSAEYLDAIDDRLGGLIGHAP